ncbi:DUF368 domain-containing protein [Clostridia bacterium]|nr:DUF368 domain-containing protein [Clostridia bacterium]
MKDNWFIRACQGAIVGTGAILPGVSGGVLCVVFGIYEPMMALLSHPKKSFKVYYKLFIPFIVGWLAGFLLLAKVVDALFAVSSSVAIMLFLGLICGTLPEMIKAAEQGGKDDQSKFGWTPFVVALAAAFLLFRVLNSGSVAAITPNIAWYGFCGAVWGLSLVVPGLSSSSVLICLGLYQPMTAGIAALDFRVLLPLAVGLAAIVALTARLVNRLYEKQYALVSRIILGIVIASSLSIMPDGFDGVGSFALSAVCFAAGFAAARFMDIMRSKQVVAVEPVVDVLPTN